MPYLKSLPEDASMLDVYRLDLELARPILRYQQQLLRGPSPLSVAQRELIGAYVSTLNACRFCFGLHALVARRFGVEETLIEQLVQKGPAGAVDDNFAAILTFAGKLTREPAKITASDARKVHAAGWDDTALFHTVLITGFFNFFNRLTDGLGLEFDEQMHQRAAAGLHEIGYEGRL